MNSAFDEIGTAASYVAARANAGATDAALYDAVRYSLRLGDLALDIGCGDARVARRLQQFGVRGVIALDMSIRMLAIGRAGRLDHGLTPLGGDACAMPIKDHSVDLAVANYVFHYVQDMPRAIAEIARVLKPQTGRLVAMVSVNTTSPGFEWLYDSPFPLMLADSFEVPAFVRSLPVFLDQLKCAGFRLLDEVVCMNNAAARVGQFAYTSNLNVFSALVRCERTST